MLTALAVCLFFALCYPHHLHFQEQFQLFMLNGNYALEVITVPGGFADYLGRFVTQFFLYAWIGAAIIGLLIAAVQILAARPLKNGWLWGLSFVPAILLTRAMCDEQFLTGSIIAILLVQGTASYCTQISNVTAQRIVTFILYPILYWAAGPIAFLYVALMSINMLMRDHRLGTIIYLLAFIIVSIALPSFLSQYVATEPQYMYSGIHYYRTHDADATPLWLSVLSIAILAVLPAIIKKKTEGRNSLMHLLLALVIAIAGSATLVYPAYNSKAEEGMAYDFMARYQQWNKIQQTASVNPPKNAISMTALNLALAKSGQLADQMFHYEQHGNKGLLPIFERDAVSPLTTAEVYYHLGMINSAQRFVFEAQEAILDYQKSSRCYKRLAETNLIRGNYKVAAKYLAALKETLFYSKWAEETSALLGNEDAINSHKEYGQLRQMLCKEDFFYNGRDLPMMLGQLYESNKQNRLAFEYLEAENLLSNDLDRFVQYFAQNTEINYATVPHHFQEALVLWWSRNLSNNAQMPPGITQNYVDGLKKFIKDAQQFGNNTGILERQYGKTYWYYFLQN